MKKLLYLLCFSALLSTTAQSQCICRQQLRTCYLQSIQRRSALDSFSALLQSRTNLSSVEECYLGICQGIKAQYADGTWAKIRLVQKSKSLMNEAVKRDPRDPELRFMRFTLEHYLPSFLGMSSDINEDLKAIFADTSFLTDNVELKKMALGFIRDTKRCTSDQMKAIDASLTELNRNPIAQK